MTRATRSLFLGLAALFFTLTLVVFQAIYPLFWTPMIPAGSLEIIFHVEPASSASQFVRGLTEKKLIHSPKVFLALIRLKGWSNQLKAGVYQIKPGETATQLLSRVMNGDVLIQKFNIIAGTRQEKVDEDLKQAAYLKYDSDDWSIVKGDKLHSEGLLLADTYHYRAGSTAKALLKQANDNLIGFLSTTWADRAPNLPYNNAYELLTAASIIEKESANAEERKLIAGVLVNRLKKGMPLQMDPTVIYGLKGDYKGKLYHKDLLIPTPYNTYQYRGLPPTPIAMVGKEALEAAAHPQDSHYLYYVSKGDGTHHFSENYEQQKKAVRYYLRKD